MKANIPCFAIMMLFASSVVTARRPRLFPARRQRTFLPAGRSRTVAIR